MNTGRWSLLVIGAGLLALFVAAAVFAPLVAPYEPGASVGPPFRTPSPAHLLGTNDVGQDIASRIVWGARTSLTVAGLAVVIAVGLGATIGVTVATIGGPVERWTMRLVDAVVALPRLPLLIVVGTLTGARGATVAIVIGSLAWAPIARILRSETLTLRTRGHVLAARGFGGGTTYLVRRHLLPALGPLLVAEAIIVAGSAVMLEASLAFLGLADPLAVSWGRDIDRALTTTGIYFLPAWSWWVLPTGGAISLAVLAFTLVGVGVEPLLNRRLELPS